MIKKGFYKDLMCYDIVSGDKVLKILPGEGGKIASISAGGFEFLEQAPNKKYKKLNYTGVFVDSECSGFDDMFPTVDEVETSGLIYPDHGVIARIPMRARVAGGELKLSAKTPDLPFEWTKTVGIINNGFKIEYRIKNLSDKTLPYVYAAHLMLKGADDLRIVTPYGDSEDITYSFGEEFKELPKNKLVGKTPSGAAYKFYYNNEISRGEIIAKYGFNELKLCYDNSVLKYLGVWINNGEFKNMYNIAAEVASAPYDTPEKAIDAGKCSYIAGGGEVKFTMNIELFSATSE